MEALQSYTSVFAMLGAVALLIAAGSWVARRSVPEAKPVPARRRRRRS